MILVLNRQASDEQIAAVGASLESMGLESQTIRGAGAARLIVVQNDASSYSTHVFNQLPGVDKVIRIHPQATKVVSRPAQPVVLSNGARIGGSEPVLMAGPCSVEGKAQVVELACRVKEAGAKVLRGGAFKPRTSPYDFQGLGRQALEYLAEARAATGLPVVSEVMAPEQVEMALEYVDILQIGARNMYNYELLREAGRSKCPVLLKRAMSATVWEWLNSAEYLMSAGNDNVILCERGIRTFETHTRNTLDLAAVAAVKSICNLPVVVDPSHGTGRPELILPMSKAAIACGADGLLIEVHDCPQRAFSDGDQAITPPELLRVARTMTKIWKALEEKDEGTCLSQPVSSAALR